MKVRLLFRAILIVPVWLIVVLSVPFFPADHPWHGKRQTLLSWAKFATPLSMSFALGFWLLGASTMATLWLLNTNQPVAGFLIALANLCFVVWFWEKTGRH